MTNLLKRNPWPAVVGLALFLASCAWAWLFWDAIRDNERSRLEREGEGLAATVAILLDPALPLEPPGEADRGRLIERRIELRSPLRYALVVRGERTVASLGEVPPDVDDPRAPGLAADGRLVVFRLPLVPRGREPDRAVPDEPRPPRKPRPGPGEGDRPGVSVPWRWTGTAESEPAFLVVGCETGLPARVYRRYVPQMAFALAVGWAGMAALVLAWYRSIRSRALARALERERRERERLEEMNLAAAGLAHETKNPLGIILGLAQRVARDPAIGEPTREAAEQIVDAADQAAARLGDFLGFARIPKPHLEPVRADLLLRRVVATLQSDFDDAGIEVAVDAPPVTLSCAQALVEQVLVNLLLNSLQASARGTRVTLRVAIAGPRAALVVEDQGCGIPPGLLADVFKPYVSGRAGGHGLGLAIVKRIVDQHGWSIAIDGAAGVGTRVIISGIEVASTTGSAA